MLTWMTLLAGIALQVAGPSSVSDATPVNQDIFRESFEPVRLSTPVVAAANLGAPDGMSSGGASFLVLNPGNSDGLFLCVLVTTRDGLFWARNPFAGAVDARYWRISQLTSRYHDHLSRYRSADVLSVASLQEAESCDGSGEMIAPAIFDVDGALELQVNSRGRRTMASLRRDGESISSAICGRAPDPVLVADRYCVLDLPDALPEEPLMLVLEFDELPFGIDTWQTPIQLPGRGR